MKNQHRWFLILFILLFGVEASCAFLTPAAKQAAPQKAETAIQPAEVKKSPAATIPLTPTAAKPSRTPTVTLIPEDTLAPSLTPAQAAPAPTLGPDRFVSPIDGMVLVRVPEGEFTMGTEEIASDRPERKVWLDTFWIDQTEVTLGGYVQCMKAGACTAPQNHPSSYVHEPTMAQWPVTEVDYKQATAYCAWAGRRLPTSAEWEKAARGTDGRKYPWGNQEPDLTLLNYQPNYDTQTDLKPVGSYPAGASPYGALDMAGNVYELVYDWYGYDFDTPDVYKNPKGPASGSLRVMRGGSYMQVQMLDLTTYSRQWQGSFSGDAGFRCAISDTDIKKP